MFYVVHSVRNKSLLGVRHTLNGRFLHEGGTSVLRPRLKIQLPVEKWVLWPAVDSDNADQTPTPSYSIIVALKNRY